MMELGFLKQLPNFDNLLQMQYVNNHHANP